jgi:hypothetical protein
MDSTSGTLSVQVCRKPDYNNSCLLGWHLLLLLVQVSVQYWLTRAHSDDHHIGPMCAFCMPVSDGAVPQLL